MSVVAARPVNVLGSASGLTTIFRDSYNRTAGDLGSNWAGGSKTPFPFTSGNIVTSSWNIGAMTATCAGNGLRFDHTAPTFNPAASWPFWGIAVPTANSLINGRSQFSSARLCSTARTGAGNLDVGPAVFVNMSVEFGGSGYFLDITASTHAWSLQKCSAGTFSTLASGVGIVDGDTLSLQLTVNSVGNVTLVAFQNSSTLTTQVDASALLVGYPGWFAFASSQNGGTVRSEWQNWIGGLGAVQAF